MIKHTLFFICILWTGCKENIEETPELVAKDYCNCITEQLRNAKDSSVNIYDCETTVFGASKILRARYIENQHQYSKEEIDSAFHFLLQTGDIIDTMCLNKLDKKKILPTQHIKL